MINPVRTELLDWLQASVGWAALAVRAARPGVDASPTADADPTAPEPPATLRLRATITIDIDAPSLGEAERETGAIRGQFEQLKRAHPSAELAFQRRKPRTSRRPATPTLVVSPYADD